MRPGHRGTLVAAAGLALVLATGAAFHASRQPEGPAVREPGPEPQADGVYPVTPEAGDVPAAIAAELPYVLGDRLYPVPGDPERLSSHLSAPLLGTSAALAVLSRDRRYLAYHAWRDMTPLLYVRDLRTGAERLLARGAQTVAWGADGQIAYFQATRARHGRQAYVGHVVVHDSLDAAPVRWTAAPDAFEVRAWARDRLLVAVRHCALCPDGGLDAGLYSLGGPGELLPLPLADLSALSPDGSRALGRFDPVPGQDSPSPLVRIVELEPIRVAATLDLGAAARSAGLAGPGPAAALYEASWRGDEVVATSLVLGESALVVLRVGSDRLELDEILRLAPDSFPARNGVSLGRPSFAGTGTDRVVVQARWEPQEGEERSAAVLLCERASQRCTSGTLLAGTRWFALAESPSRP